MAFDVTKIAEPDSLLAATPSFQPDRTHRLTMACVETNTLVETVDGHVAAADLSRGTRLWSQDLGPVPVLRVARFWADPDLLQQQPDLQPIQLSANALGVGAPCRDMVLAGMHPIRLDQVLGRRFAKPGTPMIPAHQLTQVPGVSEFPQEQSLDYVALLVSGARTLRLNWSLCQTFAAQASTLEILFGLSVGGDEGQTWATRADNKAGVLQ